VGHRCHGQGPHHGVRHAFRGLSRGSIPYAAMSETSSNC